MNTTPDLWVSEPEAAELLAIKNSTIRTMRRDGRLTPGDHFIFATGTAGGPVSYNVSAIRQSMAERTKEMVEAEAKRRAETQQQRLKAIETYAESRFDLRKGCLEQ